MVKEFRLLYVPKKVDYNDIDKVLEEGLLYYIKNPFKLYELEHKVGEALSCI